MGQLNRVKTPLVFRIGLIAFFALVVTMNMVGGLLASYTSTFTGTGTALIASFPDGTVTADSQYLVTTDYDAPNIHSGYYMFDSRFHVNVPAAEVARMYTLTLFVEYVSRSIDVEGKSPTFKVSDSELRDVHDGRYLDEREPENKNQNVSCSWGGNVTVNADTIVITGVLGVDDAIDGTIGFYYYLPSLQGVGIESGNVRCELKCEQVD